MKKEDFLNVISCYEIAKIFAEDCIVYFNKQNKGEEDTNGCFDRMQQNFDTLTYFYDRDTVENLLQATMDYNRIKEDDQNTVISCFCKFLDLREPDEPECGGELTYSEMLGTGSTQEEARKFACGSCHKCCLNKE